MLRDNNTLHVCGQCSDELQVPSVGSGGAPFSVVSQIFFFLRKREEGRDWDCLGPPLSPRCLWAHLLQTLPANVEGFVGGNMDWTEPATPVQRETGLDYVVPSAHALTVNMGASPARHYRPVHLSMLRVRTDARHITDRLRICNASWSR
jgi:hypothetical protein